MNKKKASRAIARFVSLHPYNLAQKTEVMIEYFRQIASYKIGGKAKAMVVTGSRLHAVRYYFEFKKYLKEKQYNDIKPLVAFSGKVEDTFQTTGKILKTARQVSLMSTATFPKSCPSRMLNWKSFTPTAVSFC